MCFEAQKFMKTKTTFAPLCINTCKLLGYALIGFLSYIKIYGCDKEALFANEDRKIGDDAVYLFGVPGIFEVAKQKHLPKVMRDVLRSLDEYDVMPKSTRDAIIEKHLAGLYAYLSTSSSEGGDFSREIFNWIKPVPPSTS